MLEPRKAVTNMRPYRPPTSGRADKLRLDFNENTVGCSPRVLAFLSSQLSQGLLSIYPDYEGALHRLSAHFGVSADQMMLTNGTDEAIQVAVNTFVEPGDPVLVLNPSYAMYRFYGELAGAKIHELDYCTANLTLPFDELLKAAPDMKVVFLSNPNNPTGSLTPLEQIQRLLEATPDTAIFVDEAYFEFCGVTALPWINEYPNLLVSRTLSKAYGLAALRCGFLFSNSACVAHLRKAQSPYSVNAVAALAAEAAVSDGEFIGRTVSEVIAQRDRVSGALSALGIRVAPSHGNFLLIWANARKDCLLDRCARAGILVRDRSHEIPGTVRVTVGTAPQMDRFLDIMEALWNNA